MFLISDALAAGEAAAAGGVEAFMMQLLPLIVIFGVFWFFLIRPQQKKQKKHQEMVAALKKGDTVLTASGVLARIIAVDKNTFDLQIADVDGKPVVIQLDRDYIRTVLPKEQQLKF